MPEMDAQALDPSSFDAAGFVAARGFVVGS
jgi:hypothetical protein